MVGTIAIPDEGWYRFLADRAEVTELNFWTPSARRTFRAPQFSPFLFKLRAPHNAICGFAYFAQFSRLPDWLAWESFGLGNGCALFGEMRSRIAGAYGRGCAVTEEHSLPALEASHIRPYASEGPHEIRNGVLLRADLHRLFDTGYATVTPDLRLEISERLREDYQNGRSYYPLHGSRLKVPTADLHRPDKAFLEWHNRHIFRG